MYKLLCDPTCTYTYHRIIINDVVLHKSIMWGNPVVRSQVINIDSVGDLFSNAMN
jgi:hypothetical protein